MKGNMPSNKKELKCFRSFKNFEFSYLVVVLSNVLVQSFVNSESDKEGGLYKPDINHFLLFIVISMHIDSIVWYSLCAHI
jgi:hypothetical protein